MIYRIIASAHGRIIDTKNKLQKQIESFWDGDLLDYHKFLGQQEEQSKRF